MKNLTSELISKAKTAKSAEALLALAKENGVELTEEEAKTYFEQLNKNDAVSDDELNAVAGGGDCPELRDYAFGGPTEEEMLAMENAAKNQPGKIPPKG